jgi:hypothetical protein
MAYDDNDTNDTNAGDDGDDVAIRHIGIIGGGASGLATARSFLRANDGLDGVRFEVTVLESRDTIGGIWKYEKNDEDENESKSRPMYRNLRTNLPKELMAYREFPWGCGDGSTPSYVSHDEVQEYLEGYATEFDLKKCIRFGCAVNHLEVLKEDAAEDDDDDDVFDASWPRISLEWTDRNNDGTSHRHIFDGVCICNGHYSSPSMSHNIMGLDKFVGRVIHSVEYDDPNEFANTTVLCIGGRASGMDIAREIGRASNNGRVYLSDSTCRAREVYGYDNSVIRVPRTLSIDDDGRTVRFAKDDGNEDDDDDGDVDAWIANDVDVIILCTGYDYSFPFVSDGSNLKLTCKPGERRVMPLYMQLWHALHVSISFIGLPHSVVPFPFFEFQSDAVVSQWISRSTNGGGTRGRGGRDGIASLPSTSERMALAERDANAGGPTGRITDTHYLGSHQWEYCRSLSRMSGRYDDGTEDYICTNEAIYECSKMEREGMVPGGEDLYRETRFRRLDDERSYDVLYSEMRNVLRSP